MEYSEGQTKSSFTKLLMMCSFQWTNGHFCSICSIWHFIYLLFIILINYHNGMERRKNYKMYATQTYADLYGRLTDWLWQKIINIYGLYIVHPSTHLSVRLSDSGLCRFLRRLFTIPFIHSSIRPTNQPLHPSPPKISPGVSLCHMKIERARWTLRKHDWHMQITNNSNKTQIINIIIKHHIHTYNILAYKYIFICFHHCRSSCTVGGIKRRT